MFLHAVVINAVLTEMKWIKPKGRAKIRFVWSGIIPGLLAPSYVILYRRMRSVCQQIGTDWHDFFI